MKVNNEIKEGHNTLIIPTSLGDIVAYIKEDGSVVVSSGIDKDNKDIYVSINGVRYKFSMDTTASFGTLASVYREGSYISMEGVTNKAYSKILDIVREVTTLVKNHEKYTEIKELVRVNRIKNEIIRKEDEIKKAQEELEKLKASI